MDLGVDEAVAVVPEVDMEATQPAMCKLPQLQILDTSPHWVASDVRHHNLRNGFHLESIVVYSIVRSPPTSPPKNSQDKSPFPLLETMNVFLSVILHEYLFCFPFCFCFGLKN